MYNSVIWLYFAGNKKGGDTRRGLQYSAFCDIHCITTSADSARKGHFGTV